MATLKPSKFKKAFTLVELLVVIGIIALLISILLPALSKARRSANTVKCASNMKMISLAVISYTLDNKGKLMPCLVYSTGNKALYPDGFFWAAELVHQKYITAPYLKYANNTAFPPENGSVFQCPEGINPQDNVTNGQMGSSIGTYPTNVKNNGWFYGIDDNPRVDGQTPYGIATWYQINSRLTGYATNYNTGNNNAPFVYFQQTNSNDGSLETDNISSYNYTRNLSMVRKPSVMVMMGEATDPNWLVQNAVSVNGVNHYASRIGARHGQKSVNGTNAYTNFAFFDGHVALFPTYPIDSHSDTNNLAGQPGPPAMGIGSGTTFTLFMNGQ